MSTQRFATTLTLGLTLGLSLVTLASAADEPTLAQRLERLANELETARQEAHVPGMSIAIVKDDKVVLARGFGLADVDAETPATEATIYAIGSTTKAFTATLVGTLVDEGKANWDDPVTKFLPHYDLPVRSGDPTAVCTLRDLLCHRHGFARMSLAWIGGNVSRDEVLATTVRAEPWDDFRKAFHYCNVTYMAAGEAAGAAAGSSWDQLMAERLFAPLKMTSTSTALAVAQGDDRLSVGYSWDSDRKKLEQEPMFDLDAVAPAGSVNSNVLDMAQWLRFQLGKGEIDGRRILSAEQLLETWTPQIEIEGGATYGLGWMLHEQAGHAIVEHGGNINGFTAQVTLVPEQHLGYVLLMNLDVAPLRQVSIDLVLAALLGEQPADAVEPVVDATEVIGESEVEGVDGAPIYLDDYAGVYIANFMSFRDAEVVVTVDGDGLNMVIPGQPESGLLPPSADGHWTSTVNKQVAVSFQRDADDAVVGLTIHTSGFHFEVPRKGVDLPSDPAVSPEEFEKYTGTYVRVRGGKQVKLFVERGQLTMEDNGKYLAFETPDEEAHAPLRARADHGATFQFDAEGAVDAFMYHGSAGDRLFRRVAGTLDAEVPSLAEVLALRSTKARVAAIEAAEGTKITGKVWVAQSGVSGDVTIYTEGSDRYATHLDFGKFGRIDSVARGRRAWAYNPMKGFDKLKGEALTQALLGHPGAVEGDWSEYFDSIDVLRNDEVDGRRVHVVRLRKGSLPSRTYWVDAEHGDVLQVKQVMIERTVRIPVTVTYSDFDSIGGIRTPKHIEVENPASGRMVMTLETFESGLDLGRDVFALEDADAK